jgi:DNA-binding IclR family transcriptional regulator
MNDRVIIQAAWTVLCEIERQTGLTVGLARLEKTSDRNKALAIAHSRKGFGVHISDGAIAPLHNNAPGKALIAFLSASERKKVLQSYSFGGSRTASTLCTVEAFRADIANSHERTHA